MTNLMDRLWGKKPSPAQSAKDRLKLVLVTDRTTISPEDLRKMQNEIIEIIRKYCRVKEEDVNMKFEQRERENYLVADIPLATRVDQANDEDASGGSVRLETTLISVSDSAKLDDSSDTPAADASSDDTPPADASSDKEDAAADDTAEKVQVKGAPTGIKAKKEDDQKDASKD